MANSSSTDNDVSFKSCYARFQESRLTVGNHKIERSWDVKNGLLYPTSLIHKITNQEWISEPSSFAVTPDFTLIEEKREVSITSFTGAEHPTSEEALLIQLVSKGEKQSLQYDLSVYPNASAITVQVIALQSVIELKVNAESKSHEAHDKMPDGSEVSDRSVQFNGIGCVDFLELAPPHLKLRQIEFWDQTDRYNELVFEKEWLLHPNESRHMLPGNVFVLEDPLTDSGFVFIKHGPLPHVRPVKTDADLIVDGNQASYLKSKPRFPLSWRFYFQSHGTDETGGPGYKFAVVAYDHGKFGMTAALQDYQRQMRKYEAKRDVQFLSNTWGDRSRDAKITEHFILAEIEAGARLGVDVIQIDAGWQVGTTINSVKAGGVWEGFWAHESNYWDVDLERFPNGLEPVIKAAADKGMRLGLWFAPDSSNDFDNWERDAKKILELYAMGIHYIKIDAVKARTKKGEQNLLQFFNEVLEASNGEVVFDIDVTAEVRPGYWGLVHPGPMFVENRYTDSHRYWPHQTLRNLWKLAQYIDPARLRMEFLNHERNQHVYVDDPIAPAEFSPDYLFATTMISNPLGWFEVSSLPATYYEKAAPLVKVWKQHRKELFEGHIYPIGKAPDGVAWTGFLSLNADKTEGYILLFRENNSESQWMEQISCLKAGKYSAEILYGEGKLEVEGKRVTAAISEKKQILFAKIS